MSNERSNYLASMVLAAGCLLLHEEPTNLIDYQLKVTFD